MRWNKIKVVGICLSAILGLFVLWIVLWIIGVVPLPKRCPRTDNQLMNICVPIFNQRFWMHPEWPMQWHNFYDPPTYKTGPNPSGEFVPVFLPEESPRTASTTNMKIVRSNIDLTYPANFSDDKILVGASHNIFVGMVIQQIGNKTGIGGIEMLQTQFSVRVLLNIKGNLEGTVVVNEFAGVRGDTVYVMDGTPWLESGKTYLLTTRYGSEGGWHTLNTFPGANKLISSDSVLSDTQLQETAKSDLRVKQLQATYPKEILLDADISHDNTRNSYQSLTEAQKYALPYYTGSYNPNPPAPTSTASSTATSTGN